MANEHRSKTASEILDTLHDLSLDTEEEILAMPRDQVRDRLVEEGLNPDTLNDKLASRLEAIGGKANVYVHRSTEKIKAREIVDIVPGRRRGYRDIIFDDGSKLTYSTGTLRNQCVTKGSFRVEHGRFAPFHLTAKEFHRTYRKAEEIDK